MSFQIVRPRELMSSNPWDVTRSSQSESVLELGGITMSFETSTEAEHT